MEPPWLRGIKAKIAPSCSWPPPTDGPVRIHSTNPSLGVRGLGIWESRVTFAATHFSEECRHVPR